MENFAFRIRLRDAVEDADADRLYEALDDEVAVEDGPKGHFIGFEREAQSFLHAVLDAIAEVTELGFEPLAVEDELVSIADIAERTSRSRQSVSMLVSGHRGPGNFPRPVAGNVRSPLWHWADVAAWFEGNDADDLVFEDRLREIASINGALANRVLSRVRPADVRLIQERLAGCAGSHARAPGDIEDQPAARGDPAADPDIAVRELSDQAKGLGPEAARVLGAAVSRRRCACSSASRPPVVNGQRPSAMTSH